MLLKKKKKGNLLQNQKRTLTFQKSQFSTTGQREFQWLEIHQRDIGNVTN